jgi:RNA polymerase sigma factor (sigma-70 family)
MRHSVTYRAQPTDAELVAHAREGNVASLGVLLERHRARLLATALGILGFRPDAEDAVQETFLIAMQHIGGVRDPGAVGAWLQMVVRRACLQRQRERRFELVTDAVPEVTDARPGADERIERLELRDWIWGALEQLPEPLRVTAMLRYFGSYDSYDELAVILGVPIGTVRSRLSEARVKLADALLASAGLIDDEARVRGERQARFWASTFAGIPRRGDSEEFLSHFEHDLAVGWSNGTRARGREHLGAEIDGDLAAGVRLDVTRVMSNDGITVVEGRFLNPREAPEHCPPGIALVLFQPAERATAVRLHLSPRPPRAGDE